MDAKLKERCDLLVSNRKAITDAFKWDSGLMSLAASCLFTADGLVVDSAKLKECEALLKKETSAFSEFRGNVKMPVICKMALSKDPAEYLKKVQAVYDLLNKGKILGDEYKLMAALTLCDHIGDNDPEDYVDKTNEIYSVMKENHKWLTSSEDIPFAAMLAVTEQDISHIFEKTEKAYAALKKIFHEGNAVQALSHVLALDESDIDADCAKTVNIFESLKKSKHKYGTGYELATLGTLSMLDISEKEIADYIIEADEYLKKQKGFGDWSLGISERRLYAAQMVLNVYSANKKHSTEIVLGSMLSITVAIEICMIICITSCIAVSTSSAN